MFGDVQAGTIEGVVKVQSGPTKHMRSHARELLSSALLVTNTPPNFLENPYFKRFMEFVTDRQYIAPSRYLHKITVKELARRCHVRIKDFLQKRVCFSIEEDSWTRDGRKFSAITAGVLLCSFAVASNNTT